MLSCFLLHRFMPLFAHSASIRFNIVCSLQIIPYEFANHNVHMLLDRLTIVKSKLVLMRMLASTFFSFNISAATFLTAFFCLSSPPFYAQSHFFEVTLSCHQPSNMDFFSNLFLFTFFNFTATFIMQLVSFAHH